MVYILVIISFLLESAITNIVSIDSIFIPLFKLTSLVILYPYFKNKTNFIIACLICGFIYDVSFSDSVFINTISFGISGFLTVLAYNYFKHTIYSSNFINIFIIVLYRIISYVLLVIVDYMNFKWFILIKGIYSSIIINIIYGIFIYLISNFLSKMFNIKKNI